MKKRALFFGVMVVWIASTSSLSIDAKTIVPTTLNQMWSKGWSTSRDDSSPSWFYEGASCQKTPSGLVFTVGRMHCRYDETDLLQQGFSCKGARLHCQGARCPGRACSAAARRMNQEKPSSAVQSTRVGFRSIEPRMVKQQGSIPPLRVKTTGPLSPFKRRNG